MSRIVIAEVKTRSPFGFESRYSWKELLTMARETGDWIAVHTDPRWGGSLARIREARKAVPDKILVAKGIHPTDHDVLAARLAGADRVLVVGRVPRWPDFCLWEPLSVADLAEVPVEEAPMVVWNQRDLSTGKPKTETFEQARAVYSGFLIQASYLKSRSDVASTADGVLVGEALPEWHRKGGLS